MAPQFSVYNRVELALWDALIYALSKSRIFRSLAASIYRLVWEGELKNDLPVLVLVASFGFIFGIALFCFSILL